MNRCTLLPFALLLSSPALAQTQAPPAPPPIQTVRVPVASASGQGSPVVPVTIRIMQGGKPLWTGTLSIGGTGQTRLSLSEPVAMPAGCTMIDGRSARQIELTVTSRRYGNADQGSYQLSLRYSRPATDAPCPVGTRGSSIEQGFSLDRAAVTFEGDGDLRITIQPQ